MQISTKSMIYRSFSFQNGHFGMVFPTHWRFNPPENLCEFMRGYLGRTIFNSALLFLAGFALFCISYTWLNFFTIGANGHDFYQNIGFGLTIVGFIGLGALLVVKLIVEAVNNYDKYKERQREELWKMKNSGIPLPQKQPSIILEWYRAFKGKYCPRLEFVDEA